MYNIELTILYVIRNYSLQYYRYECYYSEIVGSTLHCADMLLLVCIGHLEMRTYCTEQCLLRLTADNTLLLCTQCMLLCTLVMLV